MRSRRQFIAWTAAVAGAWSWPARSQPVPRTARLVLGFSAGGAADTVCRLLVEKLGSSFSSNLVVENRPGAGGRIAAEAIKNGEPDGSLFTMMPASMLVIYPHVYKALRYDPLKDFAPVSTACTFQFALSVGPLVPASVVTVQDFALWCVANPSQANFGSPGEGTMAHFAGIMIGRALGIRLTHVPYKGGLPAIQDVVGGQIAAAVTVLSEPLPFAPSGRVRVLATTGASRSPFLPEAPTMQEAGYGDVNLREYFAVLAPARTPPETVERLSSLIRAAVATQEVKDRLAKLGYEASGTTPASLSAMLKTDLDRWGPVVRSTGFSIDG